MRAGEQRLDGTLQRMDCPAAGPARFEVRSEGGVTQLEAARLAGVVFLSYRDDLTGSVSCGALKEPIHVYVTWRGGEAGRKNAVVAIEFLPKN